MGAGPILRLSHVSRRFGQAVALSDVSFDMDAGEVVCLLGHSGCGKSTLLRIIAGVEQPTGGSVHIGGVAMVGPGIFVEPEQRHVGLMFQDYALFPHLTIIGNILFGLRRHARAEAERRAGEALARVGLTHYAGRYPHQLSGGEQQRVALARALVPRPHVLLMDEPFSNLDQRLRASVRDETIALLRESGTSVVMVTHDPQEAIGVADRIILMNAGAIEQAGTPQDLYERPASLFAARFLSDFSELSGVVRGGLLETASGSFPASHIGDGACGVACIRPGNVQIVDRGEGIEALVHTVLFAGDHVDLVLEVGGGRIKADVPRGCTLRRGDVIFIRVGPDLPEVFATPS